jgi:hypothetical protein
MKRNILFAIVFCIAVIAGICVTNVMGQEGKVQFKFNPDNFVKVGERLDENKKPVEEFYINVKESSSKGPLVRFFGLAGPLVGGERDFSRWRITEFEGDCNTFKATILDERTVIGFVIVPEFIGRTFASREGSAMHIALEKVCKERIGLQA